MRIQRFIDGLEILKSIYDIKVFRKRIPLYCEWEITSHCNMQCRFCSTWISNRNATIDISTEEAFNIIEQLSEVGTKMIHFTGGEPTLREDLPDLVTAAKKRKIMVFITTNGSASFEKMEKILHADLIRVSVDGTEQFHDSIRNTPGAFKDAIRTLRFLISKNTKPQMVIFYTQETSYEMLEELSDISKKLDIQLSINVLGRNINDNLIDNTSQCIDNLSTLLFTEYIQILHKLRKKYGQVIANSEPIPTVIRQGGLDVFGCRVMDIAISIKHNGGVSLPCNGLSIRHIKGSLKEIYYGKEALELRALQGRHPVCKGCYIKCMCSASALLKIKTLLKIISSYC